MLIILISWVYIFLTTMNFGFIYKKIFKIESTNFTIHHLLGLFCYALIVFIASFFIRINIEFYLVILLLNLISFWLFFKDLKRHLRNLVSSIKSFKLEYKIILLAISFISLAQSATKPYLIDNESYYIQTIKWINEFGLVKGLTNIHMFFGQYSGWHILQAGFNFPFINDLFNDLTGYLLVIFSVFGLEKLNDYKVSRSLIDLFIGSTLMFTLFYMQFINTPSPDLAIFLISQVVFYIFILNFSSLNKDDFIIILSLTLFMCLIKLTAVIIALIPIYIFVRHFYDLKPSIFRYSLLSAAVLILFIIKNIIISGYILYPIYTIDLFDFDWKQPKELIEFYQKGTYNTAFDNQEVDHLNTIQRFWFWLNTSKLHGIFNKLYIFLLVIFPYIIYKNKDRKALLIIYILGLLQFYMVWNISAQYRYYFAFIIFLMGFSLVSIAKSIKSINYLIALSILASCIPLFLNVSLNTFTKNEFAMELSRFKTKNFILPEGKSKINTVFTKENINGFKFNSPGEEMFFWGTGNGDLPCVNKQQIEYFKTYYYYMPQQRTNYLKDGFKSIKID